MKNIKSNIGKLFFGIIAITTFASCNDDEERGYETFTVINTATAALNGEWYVDIIDEATGNVLAEHVLHKTFDANDNGKMYIDDLKAGYYIKGKLNTDVNALTFSTTDEENLVDPGTTFSVTEGKILKNAAHSKGGNVVDSIYFKATFSYDPETVIIFAGHKRSGFLEDEQ